MRVRFLLAWGLAVSLPFAHSKVAAETPVETQDGTGASPTPGRLGRFHLGPFYLTPKFHIGTLGLDTNVFYTATDRRTDFSASGGPGLRIVLPLVSTVHLYTEGGLDYLYFARTSSQRRLTKNARAGLEGGGLQGSRTSIMIEGSYHESFARPSPEVDQRIDQTEKGVEARLRRRLFSRTNIDLSGAFVRSETGAGQDLFLGTDLRRTLTSDTTRAVAALSYALTAKTQLVAEGAYEIHQFPLDHSRDGRTPRATLGLQTDSVTLISGHAHAGTQWFVPDDKAEPQLRSFYADIDAAWHLTPRLQVGGGYQKNLGYTAFVTATGSPVLHMETVSAFIEHEVVHNIVLRLSGRQIRSRTDQPVELRLGSGPTTREIRNDTTYEATGELGYRIVARLWAGGSAGYAQRNSSIADFGIKGLLVGAKINFTP